MPSGHLIDREVRLMIDVREYKRRVNRADIIVNYVDGLGVSPRTNALKLSFIRFKFAIRRHDNNFGLAWRRVQEILSKETERDVTLVIDTPHHKKIDLIHPIIYYSWTHF